MAQTPAPKQAAAPKQTKATPAASVRTQATLAQLMKGILFPNSNVVFAAQEDDPAKVLHMTVMAFDIPKPPDK